MPLVDNLLSLLTQPATLAAGAALLQQRQQGSARAAAETNRYAELRERIARLETRLDQVVAAPAARGGRRDRYAELRARLAQLEHRLDPGGGPAPVGAPPDLDALRAQVAAASGALKEALRFAREDGPTHPEVRKRVADTRQALADLPVWERFELAPERLAALPPAARQAATAALPALRRLRQATLNGLDTVADLEAAAAAAGTALVALQTGVATQPPPAPAGERAPYSRYAPEMPVASGCVECGRGHLHPVAAALDKARQLAATTAWTDPAVQARLAFAQEELDALLRNDWTDAKIAATAEPARTILQEARPQAAALLAAVRDARTPADLAAVAAQAQALRDRYETALTQGRWAAWTTQALPVPPESPRPPAARVWRFATPSTAAVEAEITPVDVAQAFDRLRAAVRAHGIPVEVRALPAQPDYILEGQYVRAPDQPPHILLSPAVLDRDAYALQTEIHEVAHALLQGPHCLPDVTAQPVAQAEAEAEAVTIAAMVQAGLPIKTREGQIIEPAGVRVNWDAIRAELGEAGAQNVAAAARWIVEALRTGQGPALTAACPVPMEG